MQDEHFMRQWNQCHTRFSNDVNDGLARVAVGMSGRPMPKAGLIAFVLIGMLGATVAGSFALGSAAPTTQAGQAEQPAP
ncbi:hypothetical protein [Novosphingobium sp. ST904]|uniref:hypothetical protein n=1 Tax=Novosphingobium sp. ST904 TaxID=1684385 RepID=UPI001046DC3A|nr:hypothetical protein [Novosphingobium sp. ST904]TCM40001.1 hypothetical protein EDF59_105238 [Novosphingobium sp. ST904]